MVDDQGRHIILHSMVQDTPFLLINIYAPNKCAEQSDFFNSISNEIKTCVTLDCSIALGGDFNVTFDPELDGSAGIKKRRIRLRTWRIFVWNKTYLIYGVSGIPQKGVLRGGKNLPLFKDG